MPPVSTVGQRLSDSNVRGTISHLSCTTHDTCPAAEYTAAALSHCLTASPLDYVQMRHMAELPVTSTPAAAAWSFATLDNNTDQSGSSHNAATAPTIEESHTLMNPSHAPATPEHPNSTASAGSTPRAEYSFHHNHDTFSRLPEADEHTALLGTTSSSSDAPSSPIAMDEPLSTDILPIPPPPDTTEAEQAFHQVFDNPNAIQAVDRNLDGFSDSGYSESVAQSGSTSISSSVRDFEFENGRRYHAYRSGVCTVHDYQIS